MSYTWLVFALLSAVFAALVAIFGKIGLTGIDSNVATAIRAVVMAAFLILIVIFQGKLGNVSGIIENHRAMSFIVLSGIAGALSWLFYFFALNSGTVNQVVAIDRLSIVFAIVFALLILGEKIDLKSWIGAGLISVGAILIAWK
jgi:bacterial/archaeal transporter family protein